MKDLQMPKQTQFLSFRPLSRFINHHYRCSEEEMIPEMLNQITLTVEQRRRIHVRAIELVNGVRQHKIKALSIENFLQTYDLGSQEGLALMCLAEAYLRVPDNFNQSSLIRDKVGAVEWGENLCKNSSVVMNLATFGLAATDNLMTWGLDKEGLVGALSSVSRKLSEPVIRQAMNQAMKLMGQQFVLGETIEDALKKAKGAERKGYRHSYDMLGEGAKTKEDGGRYYESYSHSIQCLAAHKIPGPIEAQPSISVKLSALHPRYELLQIGRVMEELYPTILHLCRQAKEAGIALTIDAEESDRLEISLEILEKLCQAKDLEDWQGLGLAVQAYQKRASGVIDWLSDKGKLYHRRFCVRLVKGAYWDSEIKRTQELGLQDYPVFTRKVHSDLSYLLCAEKMFADPSAIYPQFATHNAFTVATILELSTQYHRDFEFQRLHGMGEQLYEQIVGADLPCRIYAPVGQHRDLLAYLVRRLLENGANNSFVNQIHDKTIPAESIVQDPMTVIAEYQARRMPFQHPKIPLPRERLQPHRLTSYGRDLGDQSTLDFFTQFISIFPDRFPVAVSSLILGVKEDSAREMIQLRDPGLKDSVVSTLQLATKSDIEMALTASQAAFNHWTQTSAQHRADLLDKVAHQMEMEQDNLFALLVFEGGKTLADAISEVREAIDFCRYYAKQACSLMGAPTVLPGPTGELNELSLAGRGIFVCISPWNFPLAIFLGQVAAALVTGNVVIAKPAQQTPAIAHYMVQLAHRAGIPQDVLQLVLAKGSLVGKVLLPDPRVSGVAFTGSTDVAWTINQTLAARRCALAPLIAETGGINAMIVDSSALPEQVVRDVIISAFQSAGQRCSALRLLFVQEDVADHILEMLKGAMAELMVGHTMHLPTDIGPVIDESSYKELMNYRDSLAALGKDRAHLLAEVKTPSKGGLEGNYFAPQAWVLGCVDDLSREVFGPILHIVRFKGEELPSVVQDINDKGFGLTLGLHSRIDETIQYVRKHARVGNFYVNRSMIGAVVGVQPFGGEGLSGTGPKAGGPHYLQRFVVERTFTQDTTAAGGNASLLASV